MDHNPDYRWLEVVFASNMKGSGMTEVNFDLAGTSLQPRDRAIYYVHLTSAAIFQILPVISTFKIPAEYLYQ
jgi:hypothetical protein